MVDGKVLKLRKSGGSLIITIPQEVVTRSGASEESYFNIWYEADTEQICMKLNRDYTSRKDKIKQTLEMRKVQFRKLESVMNEWQQKYVEKNNSWPTVDEVIAKRSELTAEINERYTISEERNLRDV